MQWGLSGAIPLPKCILGSLKCVPQPRESGAGEIWQVWSARPFVDCTACQPSLASWSAGTRTLFCPSTLNTGIQPLPSPWVHQPFWRTVVTIRRHFMLSRTFFPLHVRKSLCWTRWTVKWWCKGLQFPSHVPSSQKSQFAVLCGEQEQFGSFSSFFSFFSTPGTQGYGRDGGSPPQRKQCFCSSEVSGELAGDCQASVTLQGGSSMALWN